jgi:hypothetical protein
MRKAFNLAFGCSVLFGALGLQAQVKFAPLSTFGNNGWLAPGSIPDLTINDTERGLAYGNDHLYLVSRNAGAGVRILNSATGADIGGLNMAGIPAAGAAGAAFGINMAAVGGDGAIYVGNLTVNASAATAPFAVYRWATESSAPTVAYSGVPLAGARVGDSLAAIGSGSSTRLAAGFGSSPAVTGNNSYAIIDPTAGTATRVAFTGTPPNAGDFRLGLTFGPDSGHVLGSQGGGSFRETSAFGTSGALLASPALQTANERLLAYATVGGMPLLATESTTDAHVSLYDMTDPTRPALLGTANATTGPLHVNTHDVGELAWGNISGDNAVLYAMSTDQGIQAFKITVPEPGTLTLGALGVLLLASLRMSRRSVESKIRR